MIRPNAVIAVHVGAGFHSPSLEIEYKQVMKQACKEGINNLMNNGQALDAVCCATKVLEDSPLTNAGFGSSLTRNGGVECDAGIMDGKSLLHGFIGAAAGIRNPIVLAKELLLAQNEKLPGNLVPPSFLAGPGARDWAISNDIEVCSSSSMISEKSKRVHDSCSYIQSLLKIRKKRKREPESNSRVAENSIICDANSRTQDNSAINEDNSRICEDNSGIPKAGTSDIQAGALLDTVGAVCVDTQGNVASAVSSGGIVLKHSGRVGQAAVYGCGCWAQNDCNGSGMNVAVSTSGCGEHLVRTMFARMCSQLILNTDTLGHSFAKGFKQQFLESVFLKDVVRPLAGSLCLRCDPRSGDADLFWAHTTHTMGVAYMTTDCRKPSATFSHLPKDRVGLTVAFNCTAFPGQPQTDGIREESNGPIENLPHRAVPDENHPHRDESSLDRGLKDGYENQRIGHGSHR